MEKADVLRDIKIIGGQIIKSERDESVIITASVYRVLKSINWLLVNEEVVYCKKYYIKHL
jgi:hypothetical protein